MKPLPFREVKRKLEAAGFKGLDRLAVTLKFARTTVAGTRTAAVPKHHEVAAGTIRSILRQAGISADEFDAL
jgi:predicted RNA binding protein YcfA (HicA-like mRNA interferase family)